MKLLKFIRFYSLNQAVTICKFANNNNCKIKLISPMFAGQILGAVLFKSIIENIEKQYKHVIDTIIYDCGDEQGAVLQALDNNIKNISFRGSKKELQTLQQIAAKKNAIIMPPINKNEIIDLQTQNTITEELILQNF